MPDNESQETTDIPQGITFESKPKKLTVSEEDEALSAEMIRKWEDNHPKAKGIAPKNKDH